MIAAPPKPSVTTNMWVYDKQKHDEMLAFLAPTGRAFEVDLPTIDLLATVASNSPYLASLIKRYPEQAVQYAKGNPDQHIAQIFDALAAPRDATESEDEFMVFLREQKNLAALLIAIADITEQWSLNEVTLGLSEFARKCLEISIAKALRKRMNAGDLAWKDGYGKESPIDTLANQACGFFILGLGKLGANELNYSSDIDIIALYDPSRVEYVGRKSVSDCFIRLTQDVVRYMDQRTMNGYVFRTDLRLRPDPGATPVALSVDAALSYYHSIAANWERSAMIKATFAAGDQSSSDLYLKEMASWVWRKNMDFEALKDIAAIKNQINRHYDVEEARFAGFDVKLGLGGIREVEFYAQINQLLHGGRYPSLRLTGTQETLAELSKLKLIPEPVKDDLLDAYRFLRDIEHRIQMTNDEQCHTIPNDDLQLTRLTAFMGFPSQQSFEAEVRDVTNRVKSQYDALLPDAHDEDAILTDSQLYALLKQGGFENPDSAMELIAAWKYGRYRCLRTARARSLLEQCLPELLKGFTYSSSPDAALARFDSFLAELPAGVQLFSLLRSNPTLLKLLAKILSLAPALANSLAKSPGLWDSVLDRQFFGPPKSTETLKSDLSVQLSTARDFQDILDIHRRFAAEQKFRAGVLMLEGIAGSGEITKALSDVADAILQTLVPAVESDFAVKHGRFRGDAQGIAVIAFGKYGGQELTHTSDLDIVFLYPPTAEGEFSDGQKPLSATVYYARLAQHITTAITALTPEGRLFEVDTRLRPSGNQGPLAVSLPSLVDYYERGAWAWEFMALVRARLIHAPKSAEEDIRASILTALSRGKKRADLSGDVLEMRAKLAEQFTTGNIWNIKHARGGLIDVEFICQYLVLVHIEELMPQHFANVPRCLEILLAKDIIADCDFQHLMDAYKLQRTLQSLLRLCLDSTPTDICGLPEGLIKILTENTYFSTPSELTEHLKAVQLNCLKLFEKYIA